MDHSFSNDHLAVRVLDSKTKLPKFGLTVGDKNFIVVNDNDEYVIEATINHPVEKLLISSVYIDGKSANTVCQRDKQAYVHEGFRECNSEGRVIGYRTFRVSVPEICEPGSCHASNANARNEAADNKTGVIRVSAYIGLPKNGIAKYESTAPSDKKLYIEKKTLADKKGGRVGTLAGTFQERYEALPTGKIASYGALIGTVHIHPSTPFGLQCRGISMQEYWATVDDKKEDKDEEIVPKEEEEEDQPRKKLKTGSRSIAIGIVDLTD